MRTITEIRKDFVKWNGWGPPTSKYHIIEYCRSQTKTEEDSDHAFKILVEWMDE